MRCEPDGARGSFDKSVRMSGSLGYLRECPRGTRALSTKKGWRVEMRLPLGGCLVTGIMTFGSVIAWAGDTKTPFPSCTTSPTEADRKAAQGAFEAGRGSFNEADYP